MTTFPGSGRQRPHTGCAQTSLPQATRTGFNREWVITASLTDPASALTSCLVSVLSSARTTVRQPVSADGAQLPTARDSPVSKARGDLATQGNGLLNTSLGAPRSHCAARVTATTLRREPSPDTCIMLSEKTDSETQWLSDLPWPLLPLLPLLRTTALSQFASLLTSSSESS